MAPIQNPGKEFPTAYAEWASGGWGVVLTGKIYVLQSKQTKEEKGLLTPAGNVQVSNFYLGAPTDISIPSPSTFPVTKEAWRNWASASQENGTPTLVQLNHPGRQSPYGAGPRSLWTKNIAPSAVKLNFGPRWIDKLIVALGYGTPRAMTAIEVEDVVSQFTEGAKMSEEAGFKGVQLHAA